MNNSTKLFCGAILPLALSLSPLALAADKPLLLEGKTTLYQRVLVKPEAKLHTEATGKSKTTPITPFTVLYVYAREKHGNREWIKVGPDIHGSTMGWLEAKEAIAWNQGLSVSFRAPGDNDRVLLFRDKKSLQDTLGEADLTNYKNYYASAVKGESSSKSPVVSIAPADVVDLQDSFYLVPILDHEDTYLKEEQATLLRVASVPLKPKTAEEIKTEAAAASAVQPNGLKTGVVFVIDSTLSMGPYIDRTRAAVRKIYQNLEKNHQATDLRFGLIAFRDNVESAPGLGYLTDTFASLEQGKTEKTFFAEVNKVRAATVSSKDFNEDPYAGVKAAIEGMKWDDLDARYIILITDAGARDAADPLGATKLGATELQKMAQDKRIAMTVLHLKTPIGTENHAEAEKQYRALSNYPGVGELYYGVETGDVNRFGTALDTLTSQISAQLSAVEKDRQPDTAADGELAKLQKKIAKLGFALQMQYLKNPAKGSSVPDVIDAWLVDRDPAHPERETLEVNVLLTRDQISELHDSMRSLLNSFEEGLIAPDNFLENVKSIAAKFSRDPEQLKSSGGGTNLAQMGLMQEYLDGLPYRSEVMGLTSEDWALWSPQDQIQFTHRLEEKIAYYRALYENSDLWVTPGGGETSGSSVFALPLTMMP